jgi:hypothetical protein
MFAAAGLPAGQNPAYRAAPVFLSFLTPFAAAPRPESVLIGTTLAELGARSTASAERP